MVNMQYVRISATKVILLASQTNGIFLLLIIVRGKDKVGVPGILYLGKKA